MRVLVQYPYLHLISDLAPSIITILPTMQKDFIATAGLGKSIQIWSVSNEITPLYTIAEAHESYITGLTNYQTSHIVSTSLDKYIKIWKLTKTNYSCISSINTNYEITSLLSFTSTDSKTSDNNTINTQNSPIIIANMDEATDMYSIRIYPSLLNSPAFDIRSSLHASEIRVLEKVNDNTFLSGGSSDRLARSITLTPALSPELVPFIPCDAGITAIAVTSDNKAIIATQDSKISLWDMNNFTSIRSVKAHEGWIYKIIFLNEKTFATCSSDKSIKFWNYQDFQCIKSIDDAHVVNVRSLVSLSNGSKLVSGSYDLQIKLWDLNTFKLLSSAKSDSCLSKICQVDISD